MRIFNFSSAAARAIAMASGQAPSTRQEPLFSGHTASGASVYAQTFTGVFRALRQLAPAEQASPVVYDEDGYCLYR